MALAGRVHHRHAPTIFLRHRMDVPTRLEDFPKPLGPQRIVRKLGEQLPRCRLRVVEPPAADARENALRKIIDAGERLRVVKRILLLPLGEVAFRFEARTLRRQAFDLRVPMGLSLPCLHALLAAALELLAAPASARVVPSDLRHRTRYYTIVEPLAPVGGTLRFLRSQAVADSEWAPSRPTA
jgi:hypothetical protein